MKVPFYLHNVGDEEIRRVVEVLKTPFLTTGEVTAEFEDRLASYVGAGDTVGVTSCTMGLFLSLKALGIGEGDEVITTPLSFIATANTILHAGATPVFVDVDSETGNIDIGRIEAAITPRTRAVVPVHLYGLMVDMVELRRLADRHGLRVIEDAAHAIEAVRDGARPGALSDAACFSFYATKNITSGEGGAIATNSEDMASSLRIMRLHGMSKSAADRYTAQEYEHYDMELLGYKCNMDNIQAALLLGQLDRIDERLERREQICRIYEEGFAGVDGVEFPQVVTGARSARHLFPILVAPERRDRLMKELNVRGIGVAVNFRPIHLMKYYRETFGWTPGSFPEAERIGSSQITLPLYTKLTADQVRYVIDSVAAVVRA